MKPQVDDLLAGSRPLAGGTGKLTPGKLKAGGLGSQEAADRFASVAASPGMQNQAGDQTGSKSESQAENQTGNQAAKQPEPGRLFAESVGIMAQLRSPGGCAWDREQTSQTLRKYLVEEAYEVLDAIEHGDPADLCDELGDLLLQVVFHAQIEAEAGRFSIADVVAGLNRKLVRRHPHVFGEAAAAAAGNAALLEDAKPGIGAGQVLRNWQAIKQLEKKQKATHESAPSRLEGILRTQPALLEAQKLGAAAARCGFDWPDATGLLAKIREEADEVAAELDAQSAATASNKPAAGTAASRELQLEVGDLLFVTANLARHAKVDPEMALRDANAKFRSRFEAMEQAEREQGGPALEQRSLEQLEQLWQQAKQKERQDLGRYVDPVEFGAEQGTEGATASTPTAGSKPGAETA